MRLEIKGRQVTITPALRQLVTARLGRLERVLNDAALSAHVVFTKEKYRHRTEVVVHTRGDHMLNGDGEANGWTLSVRQATEKIEQQAKKLKGKWNDRKRGGSMAREVAAAPPADGRQAAGPRVIRNRRYPVKPMSVEDAALQLDGRPETFVIFRNADNDRVGIMYRRKDGNLGLIEPD